MLAWLGLALVVSLAAIATVVLLVVWRTRRTAPRTLSLLLGWVACAAIVLAVVDVPLPAAYLLCGPPVRASERPLAAAIEAELDAWRWWWTPCRHLRVVAASEDLDTPIDFARLAALAAHHAVAVDVSLAGSTTWPGESLEWSIDDTPPRALAIDAPIPASMSDLVRPRFERTSSEAPRPVCRLDQDASDERDDTLEEFLDAGTEDSHRGFHLLQCRDPGLPNAAPVSAYVHVTTSSVVLASSKDLQVTLTRDTDHFELMPPIESVREDDGKIDTATLLILDRPKSPVSCLRARSALMRGASVVVAMPEESFFSDERCDLPLTPLRRSGKHVLFDRRPRFTYLLDDFAEKLRDLPSFHIVGTDTTTISSIRPDRSTNIAAQRAAAVEACRRAAPSLFTSGAAACDESRDPPPDGFAAFQIVKRSSSLPDRSADRDRLDRASPLHRLKEHLADRERERSGGVRNEVWENEVVVLFTHDPRPVRPPQLTAFYEHGSRLDIRPIMDPFGSSLARLYLKQKTSLSAALPEGTLVANPSKRGRPIHVRPTCKPLERCMPDLEPETTIQTRAEIHAPGGRFRFSLTPAITEAPVRFGWWDSDGHARVATTTEDAGIVARPLALGSLVGPGHLLFLGYSPFDDKTEWKQQPSADDILGKHQLIVELYNATEPLLARLAGPVLAVERRTDGAVWVTLVDTDPTRGPLATRTFASRDGVHTIHAPLVDFHVAQQTLTYALPASEVRNLPRCTRFLVQRPDGALEQHDPIHACPPAQDTDVAMGIDPATSLRLLARYTGGSIDAADPQDKYHSRRFGLGLLSLVFLFAWGRRAWRRLAARTVRRRLRRLEQHAQRRYDPPDAIAAAAGDWDGRSSTWPRTGAFGGFRALEAGDRPSAVVLQDLVLPPLGGQRMLPRVVTRIEEASPTVVVLVNLGASMRVPSEVKALFAGRVALQLAAAAWKIRGEVAIHAVGVRGDGEVVEATHLSPGEAALEAIRQRLRQRPTRSRTPWPEHLEECGAVLYVSDFQLEDATQLQQWVTRLEASGVRVGGVMVYSPVEFTMIEGGRLAGSAAWADRADWDPDDVFAAFGRRRDDIERIFDTSTTGGLIVASTHYSQDDLEVVLAGGRLLQIFR